MYDLIIIGGGASGLFLAANIEHKKVLLIEKMKKVGSKLLITGGGMCNLTNCDETDEFLRNFGGKRKINFLKPALLNLSTKKTFKWFENNGLKLITREDGKVFPESLKAQSVIDVLMEKARENKVEFRYSGAVTDISKNNDTFKISTGKELFSSTSVVIATGGKSFESTGSDGSGYNLAKSLGHKIVEPVQALVSVNVGNYQFADLAGNSIRDAFVDFYRENEEKRYLTCKGDLLFTHKGISGPVILNNSRNIIKNDLIKASLIETDNKDQSRIDLVKLFSTDPKKNIKTILKQLGLVSSLGDRILQISGINKDCKCAVLNRKSRNKLISLLLEYPFKVSGKGYFSSAMVTAGGIDLGDVNRKTMESKIVPNLYFSGEVLDIDGNTGGYNIQAAFSTAKLIADNFGVVEGALSPGAM